MNIGSGVVEGEMTIASRARRRSRGIASALMAMQIVATLMMGDGVARAQPVTTYQGTFADGATYLIEVPRPWNGTLMLYSHGSQGLPNPARDAFETYSHDWLLNNGYALSGSSFSSTFWAVAEAFTDQMLTLDTFDQLVGHPARTIAWGHSMGGLITQGLIQLHPERFSGALVGCAVGAGTIGFFNARLDHAFVMKTLLSNTSAMKLTNIGWGSGQANAQLQAYADVLTQAQSTAAGRARLALAAAMVDTPGWKDPLADEPAATDYLGRQVIQYQWDQYTGGTLDAFFRAELENRAGGNFSWNTGVDYSAQLRKSVNFNEVQALYTQAGLDLAADLATLASTDRISADHAAVDYASRNIVFNGQLAGVSVLTYHDIGDGTVTVQQTQAYADAVGRAGNIALLRQLYIYRAGHCEFTPAETVVAFQQLIARLDTGTWPSLAPSDLNDQAVALGNPMNVLVGDGPGHASPKADPAFQTYVPAPFLRPYDTAPSEDQTP